jgi:hypothetical protein
MSNIRKIGKLLEPLINRRDDLAYVSRWLLVKPVHHVFRGVTFDRGFYPGSFRAYWSVSALFDPDDAFGLTDGRLFYPPQPLHWDLNEPTAQEALIEVIETQVLPLLKPVRTIQDYVAFCDYHAFRLSRVEWFLLRDIKIQAALGNFDQARTIGEQLVSGRTLWTKPDLRELWEPILTELHPLLQADDRAGVARLLHRWERGVAESHKLGSIWEPSPFPFETVP